jgi:hypothetical protein
MTHNDMPKKATHLYTDCDKKQNPNCPACCKNWGEKTFGITFIEERQNTHNDMTKDEYHAKVATFDQDRINAEIDRIPLNVNRSGKRYKQLTKQIRDKYATRQMGHHASAPRR